MQPGLDRPCLISRAVIRDIEGAGRVSCVLYDGNPDGASYIGLNAVTSTIVRLFDGGHTLEDVRRIVNETHHVDCGLGDVSRVVDALAQRGLLAGTEPQVIVTSVGSRLMRVLGWLVDVSFTFKVDWILARLDPVARGLAHRGVFWGLTVFGCAGILLALIQSRDVLAVFLRLRDASVVGIGSALAVAYVVQLVVNVCHEMAHGLTCRYFGGRDIRLGVGIYFFMPVFVCNTSAAWLMKKKYQRVLVSMAGPLCQMVFGAAGAVLLLLPVGHTAQLCAVILIAVGYGRILSADFNPLLRFDGYYVLADLAESPNLRSRSFAHLRHVFLRRPAVARSQRDAMILITYGTLALAYTSAMLLTMAGVLVFVGIHGGPFRWVPWVLLGMIVLPLIVRTKPAAHRSVAAESGPRPSSQPG